MPFTLREAAEISLVASRAAARTRQTFRLDLNRMKLMGFSSEDIGQIETAVRDIEQFTEARLGCLSSSATGEKS